MTEVSPADADQVGRSAHAKLVAIDAIRSIAGIIARDAAGLPLADKRARLALNLAVDRDRLVRDAMFGYAKPLAGLTPPSGILFLDRVLHPLFSPYPHDPKRAVALWRAAGAGSRVLRIAAPDKLERVARHVAGDIGDALGTGVGVTIYRGRDEELKARRRLAERTLPREWDILIWEHQPQVADGPPLELHRAFVGATGEYRAGPVDPEFETRYAELVAETSRLKAAQISHRIDRFVHDEALALFLCAPHALYAVNKHVDFKPYRTTFELAKTEVADKHWSRR